MYFRPRLPNGQLAHVAWQIRLLYTTVIWPFDADGDGADNWRVQCFDGFRKIAGLLVWALTTALELGFVIDNSNDVLLMLDEMSKLLIVVDVFMRTTNVVLINKHLKAFLKEFYAKIYISKTDDAKTYRQIERYLLPTVLYSYTYLVAVMSTSAIAFVGLFSNQRLLVFNLWLPFDMTPLYIYLPVLLSNYWINLSGVSCIVGESNLMATIVLHLNARYKLLQQELRELYASLLEQDLEVEELQPLRSCHGHGRSSQRILQRFRQRLVMILQRNVELNDFAGKLQAIYSFRIFVMLGLSAINLCVLGFTVATHEIEPSFLSPVTPYIIWASAKVVELLVLGELGSRLLETTNDQSSFYYLSNWEDVIQRSNNSVENTQLMKLIVLSIALNKEPIILTGLKFFNLSLRTSISILQGAFSYFTCLYALRQG